MSFFKNLFQKQPKVQKLDLTRRFDLVGQVGHGSMSKVWKARDSVSGRIVAVKVLDLEKTKKLEARFKPEWKKPTEGEVAVALKHPYIVRTHEFGYTLEGEQFLVMEFVEGASLTFLIEVQNEVMRQNRVRLMVELGEAIEYLHQQNFIHRDICPRNVVLDADNRIKLIDFGLVVPNTAVFRQPGNRTGTANYMAPELKLRRPTDPRIDIFSYAVTCYEMCSRRHPWPASADSADGSVKHIAKPPVELRDVAPDIDEQVAETIMRGLELNPEHRWQSMTEMLVPLREAQVRLGQVIDPPPVE